MSQSYHAGSKHCGDGYPNAFCAALMASGFLFRSNWTSGEPENLIELMEGLMEFDGVASIKLT